MGEASEVVGLGDVIGTGAFVFFEPVGEFGDGFSWVALGDVFLCIGHDLGVWVEGGGGGGLPGAVVGKLGLGLGEGLGGEEGEDDQDEGVFGHDARIGGMEKKGKDERKEKIF